MTRKFIVHPDAEADLALAKRWYDEQRTGLGSEFMLCVAEAFEKVRASPEFSAKVFQELRAARVRRFPYQVIFRVDDSQIMVVAVYHTHRDPRGWQGRVESTN